MSQILEYRYASKQMRDIWSENRKFTIWRKLWISLAEAQQENNLTSGNKPRITDEQLSQLRKHVDSHIDNPSEIHRLSQLEEQCHHDVMAHILLLGELCPAAKGIVHLGATSCDITDNADLITIKDGLVLISNRLATIIKQLGNWAVVYKEVPAIAYTHFQPAQLTTVGKRFCMWCYDLVLDLQEIEKRIKKLSFRGIKGATGTQDSFLELFGGDSIKVKQMEWSVTKKMGFNSVYSITGQTYPRKIDSQIAFVLSGIAQSAHKFGTDLRLLQHDHEICEEFSKSQVGSSAMPYKQNPVKAERICGLSRLAMNLATNAVNNASVQWLERSLDDSSNRRVFLPDLFMTVDAVLCLYYNIIKNIKINEKTIKNRAKQHIPFVLTETLMMKMAKQDGDRQEIHEFIRQCSQTAISSINAGLPNPIIDLLDKNPATVGLIPKDIKLEEYTGLCVEQVEDFCQNYVDPLAEKYPEDVEMEQMII